MHSFVVIVAKPGRRLPPEVSEPSERPPHLRFEPTSEVTWSNPTGTVVVRSWERPRPPFGIQSHVTHEGRGITAFTGHLWPRRGGWTGDGTWAEQLARRCRTTTVADLAEELAGVYSMFTFDDDGRGWLLSDPLGLAAIYTGETADVSVYASRADAAAWAIGPHLKPERDPVGVCWLPYVGYMMGDRTGFTAVRTLPQGGFVDVRPGEGSRVRSWSTTPWLAADGAAADELLGEARDDIAAHLRIAACLPAPNKLVGLTGGRDSRLILSFLLAEGLTDRFRFETFGKEMLADVVVAREIADHFGLEHEWGIRGPRVEIPFETRIREQVRDTSGMLNIWDQPNRFVLDDSVTVSGVGGEALRTNFPQTSDVATLEQLDGRFRTGWRFGATGLLRPEVRAELEREARESLFADPSGHASPVDLIDVFYLRHRMRRLFGVQEEIEGSNRVFPLYSLAPLRAAFAMGGPKRRAEFFHSHLTRLNCPELAAWRFAGPGWPEAVVEARIPARTPPARSGMKAVLRRWGRAGKGQTSTGAAPEKRASSGTAPAKTVTANQDYQNRVMAQRTVVLRDILIDDPGNPAFDVLDRTRVVDAVQRIEELDVQERIRLFGAATVALWLGEHDDPRWAGAQPAPPVGSGEAN